jgi:hypothetical protein
MMTDRKPRPVGGGYLFCPLRVGATLHAPDGRTVYFQPGDDEAAIRETIDALEELASDNPLRALDRIAHIALSHYFD